LKMLQVLQKADLEKTVLQKREVDTLPTDSNPSLRVSDS